MRNVVVESFDEKWCSMFKEEKLAISTILGEELIDIHHIGSTAVPNLCAKPIIDILIVVRDIYKIDKYDVSMKGIGYEPKGENGIANRRFYQKGGYYRTHHVHIFQRGDSNIVRHLAFRDYLIAYPVVVNQYGKLKESLANEFSKDIDSYIQGKSEFVKRVEQDALIWFQKQTQ